MKKQFTFFVLSVVALSSLNAFEINFEYEQQSNFKKEMKLGVDDDYMRSTPESLGDSNIIRPIFRNEKISIVNINRYGWAKTINSEYVAAYKLIDVTMNTEKNEVSQVDNKNLNIIEKIIVAIYDIKQKVNSIDSKVEELNKKFQQKEE